MIIEPGYNILWKGNGPLFTVLSFFLGLFDPEWRKRKWKAWHTGYVVRVLDTGEIITSQAVAKGVEAITYSTALDMGDCRVYSWLDEVEQSDIDIYTEWNLGRPYDAMAYVWTIIGELTNKFFHHPFRVVNRAKMCWENLGEFDRFMGKELQGEEEPCLISKIVHVLESKDKRN